MNKPRKTKKYVCEAYVKKMCGRNVGYRGDIGCAIQALSEDDSRMSSDKERYGPCHCSYSLINKFTNEVYFSRIHTLI